jgi:hypothetical protein
MRKFTGAVVMVVLASAAAAPRARAGDLFANHGPFVRTAALNTRGDVVPAVTRLHPVVGSLQRTSHFTNPFTHKARYTGTVYNPLLGTFGTQKFRR